MLWQVEHLGAHAPALSRGEPSVHHRQERAGVVQQVRVRGRGFDGPLAAVLPLPACAETAVAYGDSLGVVQAVQVEDRLVERSPARIVGAGRRTPPQVAGDPRQAAPRVGTARRREVGNRQALDVPALDPSHGDPERGRGHEEEPRGERRAQDGGQQVGDFTARGREHGAEEGVGEDRIAVHDGGDRPGTAPQELLDDQERRPIRAPLARPFGDGLVERLQRVHGGERPKVPGGQQRESAKRAGVPAVVPEFKPGEERCVECVETVPQRAMLGRQPIQQRQIAAVSQQRPLQQLRLSPPVGQRQVDDVAGRDLERVAARAGRRPGNLHGGDRVAARRPTARQQDDRRHVAAREQPVGLVRQVDQRHRRQLFDQSPRGGRPGFAAAEELDGAQDQAEPRRVGCEVQRPEHEIQAFPARRAGGGPVGAAPARRRGRLAPIAPGRVPYDDVELPRGSPLGQRRLRFRRLVDLPCVADEKRPSDQRFEPQRLRRPRVRIELQGGQIEAEGGDANGRFADVDAVDLPVQRGADRLAARRAPVRAQSGQPPKCFDQEDSRSARQIQDGFLAGQAVRNLVQHQRHQRKSRVEDVRSGPRPGRRSVGVGELLVDGADQLHRDHVELVREQRPLPRHRVHGVEEVGDPAEMFGVRYGGVLRREHVAVERVPEPVEQPPGGGVVAQDGGKGAVAVLALQALRRDDPPVDEVLREDRPAYQPLGGGAVQPRRDEVPLQGGQIGQQLAIDAGPAIYGGGLPPEPACLHRQPAGEGVELVQGTFDGAERPEPMFFCVPGRPRPAEAVVQIDTFRGHDPQQRREPLVPDFTAPRRDPIVGGNVRFVLEVDGDGRIAAPQRVGRELPGPAAAARRVAQKHAVRRLAAGEITGGFQHVLQRGGRHGLDIDGRPLSRTGFGKPSSR